MEHKFTDLLSKSVKIQKQKRITNSKFFKGTKCLYIAHEMRIWRKGNTLASNPKKQHYTKQESLTTICLLMADLLLVTCGNNTEVQQAIGKDKIVINNSGPKS